MATGTTADFALTRNEIIASALRKIKGWPEDGNPPVHKLREAVRALNVLLRAEDLKETGLAKSAWALTSIALPLVAGRYIYSEDEGLPEIREIITATVRGTDGGDSSPLELVTAEQFSLLRAKTDHGDPLKLYLRRARLLSDQKLYLWPARASDDTNITAGDTVVQGDYTYTCIMKHTSSTESKPGSGSSWELYWKLGAQTLTANTWVTSTAYANGDLLILNYKRPLYDFVGPFDNPDFPLGWEDYIIYKLAIRLAPEYDLGSEQRQQLKQDMGAIEAELVPAAREKTNNLHDKACYF